MSAAQSSAAANATGGSSTEKAQTAAVAVLNAYHAQLNSLQSQVDLLNGHMPNQSNGGIPLTQQQQQQQNYYNSQIQMGRQGVIKDVKSIIADFRQKHPENVPRRGRRMKGLLGNAGQVGGLDSKRLSELGILLSGIDGVSCVEENSFFACR
jgi:TolA-binding protein